MMASITVLTGLVNITHTSSSPSFSAISYLSESRDNSGVTVKKFAIGGIHVVYKISMYHIIYTLLCDNYNSLRSKGIN